MMHEGGDDSHAPSEARKSRLGRRLGAAAVAVAAAANRRSSMDIGNRLGAGLLQARARAANT